VASKILTRDQAQSRKDKAVRFAENVLDDSDLADSIADEDLDSWSERKKITLVDNTGKRSPKMASGMRKADLEDSIDNALSILQGVYQPESSREDLAGAIGDAIDALNGGDDDDDSEGGDGDDADDDDTQ